MVSASGRRRRFGGELVVEVVGWRRKFGSVMESGRDERGRWERKVVRRDRMEGMSRGSEKNVVETER